jgi:hypothetical protein
MKNSIFACCFLSEILEKKLYYSKTKTREREEIIESIFFLDEIKEIF